MKNKKMKNDVRKNASVLLAMIFTLVLASALSCASTGIVTSTGTPQDLYFVGASSNPAQWYQDAISPNADVALELCGESATSYLGAVYAFNDGSVWNYTSISYGTDSTYSLSQNSLRSGDCYITNPPGSLTISPSRLSSRTPEVFVAAFPGRIFILKSASADGSSPSFTPVTSSQLLGSYSVSRSFDQSTSRMTIGLPTINFQTQSGTFSKLASDSTFGISDDRRMVVASCTDTRGSNCEAGKIVSDASDFPLALDTGVTPSESSTTTRYAVINGLGYSLCIGPDLNTNTLRLNSASSLSVYSGESVNISALVSNSQNVDVTSSFDVGLFVGNTNVDNSTISGLASGSSEDFSYIYDTSSLSSGVYTISSTVFDSSFGDCSEANDNSTVTLTVKKTYRPYVLIDGVETDIFPMAGRPYNVTINVNDSDGNPVQGVMIKMVESNGLNVFAPLQIFQATGDGLQPSSTARVYTDISGSASFAIIPTGNKLYESAYDVYDVEGHVGNYSLYFEIFNATGEELQISRAGVGLVDNFNFTLNNMTTYSPNSTEEGSLRVYYQDTFFQQVLEFVDQTFATAFSWLDVI